MDFSYHMPTKVEFGPGVIEGLARHIEEMGASSALIVTGKSSMKKTGILRRVEGLCEGIDVSVFDKVEPDPSLATVDDGAKAAEGCDIIIALGGGSPLDAAKGISAAVGNDATADQVLYKNRIKRAGPPIIAIPTTSGTGSEVTQVSVLTDREKMVKKSFRAEHIYPAVALDDYELTSSMPQKITAQTGLDALSHALEALVSTRSQPISDVLCIEAAKLVLENLEGAYEFGDDMSFRREMMLASLMAGFGITVAGAGLSHGLSYGLWRVTGAGHGLAVGMLTPHVIRYNLGHDGGKYERVAKAAGFEGTEKLIEAIERMNDRLGVPKTLSDMGVGQDDLGTLVDASLAGSAKTNPRKVDKRSAKKFTEGIRG